MNRIYTLQLVETLATLRAPIASDAAAVHDY